MAAIRIRVGASLDAGALTIYQPLEKAAERARKNIDRSLNEAAKGPAKVSKAAKSEGDKLDRELEALANKMLRDEERAQRARTREVEKQARLRARAEREAIREANRAVTEGTHTAHGRGFGRGAAQWLAGRGGAIGIGRRSAISVSRGGALAYGLAGRAASMVGGGVEEYLRGIGLETSIGANVGRANDLTYQSQAIASAGYQPGQAGIAGVQQDPKKILGELQSVGNATATSFNDVGDALREFVAKTGDLQTGRDVLLDISKISKATNTNLVDMAEAAGEVSNHLGDIPNKSQAINAVMRVIAGQGKLGALEIKDFAAQMAKIAANAGKFEGGTVQNIGELGLLAQESKLRGGSASATQAATAVASFARDLVKPTTLKHWTAAGLSPFADKGKTTLRGPEEIILEALKYSKGDLTKLSYLFPNAMSMRAAQGFSAVYSETQGTDAEKIAAVHQEFERLRHATLTQAEISRAFGAAMGESKSKIQLANNKLEQMAGQINDALLPAVAGLAPALTALLPPVTGLIGKITKWLGLNPDEDDAARKRGSRVQWLDAARKELDDLTAQGPKDTLVRGPHGAILKHVIPGIDQSHIDATKNVQSELAGEIADRSGQLTADKQAYDDAQRELAGAPVGTEAGAEADARAAVAKSKLDADQAKLDELTTQQNQTNQILRDIHTALLSGRLVVTTPPAPPRTDASGTDPGTSEDPQ